MGCKVVYAPLAADDLEELVSYIAQDDPQAALRLGYRLADQAALALRATRGKSGVGGDSVSRRK